MYLLAQNVNYGYAVATHDKYVAIGNPTPVRYDILTASLQQTGSIDVFRYDYNTDQHVLIETLYKPYDPKLPILIASETQSFTKSGSLQTEPKGYDFFNRDKDLEVDEGIYMNHWENDYGHSIDWYNKKLAVGCRYYWDQVIIDGEKFDSSGSCVDIWDYSYSERNQYTHNDPCREVGFGIVNYGVLIVYGGDGTDLNWNGYDTASNQLFWTKIYAPPGYNEVWIYATSNLTEPYNVVSKIPVSPDGQYITFAYDLSSPTLFIKPEGVINNNPTRFHIENPNSDYSESFGHSVSINDKWLAIGSPLVSGSKGIVYLYQNNCTGSQLSWSLYQKFEPTNLVDGQLFGWDVSLNKSATFEYPDRLVVGCGMKNNSFVYFYELTGSSWVESHRFEQDISKIGPLTFNTSSIPLLFSSSYQSSSFGWSVSTWEDTVVIGAPTERAIFEYTGSSLYQQGTAYIFERCTNFVSPTTQSEYRLANKIYGDQYTLKNNLLGYSVSAYGDKVLIGIPKINLNNITSCDVRSSITQQNYCDVNLEDIVHGQWMYLTKNTSSMNWDIQKVFQKKKKFMSPFRTLGEDICIGDFSAVVGAPLLISDKNRNISLVYTESLGIALDDIMGKGYIYNLHNYKPQFYVGNVFYKNGTIVVNTSGSAFEGLYFNPTTPYTYEYDLKYKSRHVITEKQIVCTVEPGEFNISTNPTSLIPISSSFDINKNGKFDFQDVDVLLRYMQYKNCNTLGEYCFDWSSSVLTEPDEISFYNWNYNYWTDTDVLFFSSLKQFENIDKSFQTLLDFNQDNKLDINDMKILWKYFSHRLTEKNYLSYINSNCQRKQVSQAISYMDIISQRTALPLILPEFFNYDKLSVADKTGSFLAPMVTQIGLYNGLDLVAIAKVGSPIKLPKTLPLNFVIKMDF